MLDEVVCTWFDNQFIEELFKPQEIYSLTSVRQIFERLAHSSIMRLSTARSVGSQGGVYLVVLAIMACPWVLAGCQGCLGLAARCLRAGHTCLVVQHRGESLCGNTPALPENASTVRSKCITASCTETCSAGWHGFAKLLKGAYPWLLVLAITSSQWYAASAGCSRL